jgi:cbb3-type cytochrome c oxidase subunit III
MIDSRILIGLVSILLAISSVIYVGIYEPDRQQEFKDAFRGRRIEQGAAIFAEYCSTCHGIKGEGIEGRAPTLNSQYFFEERLDELGYTGSLQAYITLTVSGGRPAQSMSGPWPENMPTWSVDYGGPLRNDQIDSVVLYILSWGESAPDTGAEPTPVPGDTPEEQGQNLFQGMGCVGCHTFHGQGGTVGPDLTNVYEKGEEFVRQSILQPNAVIAEGYQPNIMPQTFGDRLSDEHLNAIISYLASE